MCQRCEKKVIEKGILESDLSLLPYTYKKWKCIVPGCKCGSRVRDYGLGLYFYEAVKIRIDKQGDVRRGGWWNIEFHWLMCAKHWPHRERIEKMMKHKFCLEYSLTKIVEYKTKQKPKKVHRNEDFF